MESFDAGTVRRLLDPEALIEALRGGFAEAGGGGTVIPEREHYRVDEALDATRLVMPAWQRGGWLGVKVVGHFPQNRTQQLPGIFGT